MPAHEMFERSDQGFAPVTNYGRPEMRTHFCDAEDYYRIQYGILKYHRDFFIDVFCAEYGLRATVQKLETTRKNIHALQDVANIEEKKGQLSDLDTKLEKLRRQCRIQELDLYEKELMIPARPLKEKYDSLRQCRTWYMRKELIEDCVSRGGCCSRGCGCCGRRHLDSERKKGIGHCTEECSCCSIYREVELLSKEKDQIPRLRRLLQSKNPAFLLKIADAYFLGPALADSRSTSSESISSNSTSSNSEICHSGICNSESSRSESPGSENSKSISSDSTDADTASSGSANYSTLNP